MINRENLPVILRFGKIEASKQFDTNVALFYSN